MSKTQLPSPAPANEVSINLESLPWGTPGPFPGLPVKKGYLRSGITTLSAQTDGEAVAIWLAEKSQGSKHTAERYRLEAERFLLWCAHRGISLSELTREDFILFTRFLEDPKPASVWISSRRFGKSDPNWRPFIKQPLSKRSRQGCLTIIYGLISWLHSTGWLAANPMPKPKIKVSRRPTGEIRTLNERQLDAIAVTISRMTNGIARARMRWIMAVSMFLAPRSSDFLEHDMSSFVRVASVGAIKWGWLLEGKGGVEAMLPVPDDVIEALRDFREAIGLPPYPTPNEKHIPLVPNIVRLPRSNLNRYKDLSVYDQPYISLTRNGLYSATKTLFRKTAQLLESSADGQNDADRLRQASTHWLRHTGLKNHYMKHKDINLTRLLARHSNINTTAIYASSDFSELAASLTND